MFFDTHAHLDLLPQPEEAVRQSLSGNLAGILHIYEPDNHLTALGLKNKFPGRIFLGCGLSPFAIERDWKKELYLLETLIPEISVIGEIGIDLHWFPEKKKAQEELFILQLEMAKRFKKSVAVHVRKALDEAVRILTEHPTGTNIIFHCFSAGPDTVPPLLENIPGIFFSFAGNLTYPSSAQLRKSAAILPKERILLETDSPYLTPQPRRGKKNRPDFIGYTADALFRSRGEDLEEDIYRNSHRALGLT